MALEEAIAKLCTLVERQNAILEKISAEGSAAKASSGGTTKGRGRPKKGAEDDDGEGASFDPERLAAVREKVKEWLTEFKADEDDPETAKRREVLDEALTKLGDGTLIKIAEITDDSMTERVETWIEKKIKAGRLTPAPKAAKGKGGEDDDI